MALYLISYDISKKDQFEYQALWDCLNEMGAVRILHSDWVLVGEVGVATGLYTKIAPLMQAKDRVVVQELTKHAQWDKLLISDEAFRERLAHARE